MEDNIIQVPVESIIPNRFQPRLQFDEEGLKELSESIRQHGIIQPLVLRRLGDKYEIVAGERRYKASQMAGLKTVPAVISDIDDNASAVSFLYSKGGTITFVGSLRNAPDNTAVLIVEELHFKNKFTVKADVETGQIF